MLCYSCALFIYHSLSSRGVGRENRVTSLHTCLAWFPFIILFILAQLFRRLLTPPFWFDKEMSAVVLGSYMILCYISVSPLLISALFSHIQTSGATHFHSYTDTLFLTFTFLMYSMGLTPQMVSQYTHVGCINK